MKYNGPKCRLCRREGKKLFLKGDRCTSQKCAVVRRNTLPGKGEGKMSSKLSEYGKQLREKQAAKRIFGISEKQMSNYYERATNLKGIAGENLLLLLEMRFDNIIYRSGLSSSRSQARQMVSHKTFLINGKRSNVASIRIKKKDVITFKKEDLSQLSLERSKNNSKMIPKWISVDFKSKKIEITRLPELEELENSINPHLIIEFYSL